jgi:vacuolar protein sorting-associated protein 13A/C
MFIHTLAIGNISDAPIRLNSLVLEHTIATYPMYIDLISRHYTQQFLGQLHRVVGSADFLGNPVGLFNLVSSGVKDVFYEPYMGIVSDRPQDVGIGLAKGTASFLKKTVYGLSDTFSKFTGSVGKGLATATMDDEFMEERKRMKVQNRPKHAVTGLSTGASSFARSIVSGVTGIVEQVILQVYVNQHFIAITWS